MPRPVLDGALEPMLASSKPSNGYFLRAESFFGVASFVDSGGIFSPDLSLYGDVPLHQQSHGQSFLALAANRFGGRSLCVLDEPEAALSVTGALALLAIVVGRRAQAGSSSSRRIRRSCWAARTRGSTSDERGLAPCAYDDLDAVRLTRGFLQAPERFIRAALEEPETGH